jgi:hypothetical protein
MVLINFDEHLEISIEAANTFLYIAVQDSLFPVTYSLLPIPCYLFPVTYSLFPIPCSLFPVPYSLFPNKVMSQSE